MRRTSKSSKTTSTTSRDGSSRRTDTLTVVVLAAGRSSRFGSNKLTYDLGGSDTLLARALRACGSYPAVVVASSETAAGLATTDATLVINEEPQRGMAHSLRLANALIDEHHAIAVLPADLLEVTLEHVASIVERSREADVTYPMRSDGTPGHPVVFSARARRFIDGLPDGDGIRQVRDHPDLAQQIVLIEQSWPYHDVDTVSDTC